MKPPIPTYIAHITEPARKNYVIYIAIAVFCLGAFYYITKTQNEDTKSK